MTIKITSLWVIGEVLTLGDRVGGVQKIIKTLLSGG